MRAAVGFAGGWWELGAPARAEPAAAGDGGAARAAAALWSSKR